MKIYTVQVCKCGIYSNVGKPMTLADADKKVRAYKAKDVSARITNTPNESSTERRRGDLYANEKFKEVIKVGAFAVEKWESGQCGRQWYHGRVVSEKKLTKAEIQRIEKVARVINSADPWGSERRPPTMTRTAEGYQYEWSYGGSTE